MTDGKMKSKLRRITHITAVVVIGLGFTACSKSLKEVVGLTKNSPDENKVITNRPLTVPPDYSLRPPTDAPKPDQPVLATQATTQSGAQPIAPLPSQIERQKALNERAAVQASQPQALATRPQPITTASARQQANAPISLGQPTASPQGQPRKRISQAEYEEKLEQARRDKIARERAKNPNYGTWRNVWKSIWD